MRIEDLIDTGRGRRTADGRVRATKRSLLSVSRSLEAMAGDLGRGGDGFAVVALFEDASYFAFEVERYTELARHGTVLVGFAGGLGDVVLPPGVQHLDLDPDEPLADEWTVLVLSEAVAGGLVATDLTTVVAATSLERGRLFSPEVGTDPAWVLEQAERILARAPAEVTDAVCEVGRRGLRTPSRGEQVLREELEAGWWRNLTFAAALEDAERQALTDSLTGAYNRRFLARYLDRAGRRAPELAAVLFDLDGFKAVNDRYGHGVGDTALRAFADVVRRHVRDTDLLVRYGGDEWLVLLPCTPLARAEERTERILASWAETRLPPPAEEVALAASAGVGVFPAAALDLEAIDGAMYAAKAHGGGRHVSLPPGRPIGD